LPRPEIPARLEIFKPVHDLEAIFPRGCIENPLEVRRVRLVARHGGAVGVGIADAEDAELVARAPLDTAAKGHAAHDGGGYPQTDLDHEQAHEDAERHREELAHGCIAYTAYRGGQATRKRRRAPAARAATGPLEFRLVRGNADA